MDFDDFDDVLEEFEQTTSDSDSADSSFDEDDYAEVLKSFDQGWYTSRARASRRMDLLGDYAGNEFFLIDGESLFQSVLDDPLLAIGRESDPSFQILHAYHTLEATLSEYTTRSANFEIVFFHENRHLTLQTGESPYVVASRLLARTLLFKHLLKLGLPVHAFGGLDDERWKEYEFDKKPMFIMINDGNIDNPLFPFSSPRVLAQRKFLYNLLNGNIAVALLEGTSYADSKILTFVYEPERQGTDDRFPSSFHRQLALVQGFLDEQTSGIDHVLSTAVGPSTPSSEQRFIQELSKALVSESEIVNALAFANVVHYYHLPSLSVRDRSQPPIGIPTAVSQLLCKDFLTPLFTSATRLLSSAFTNVSYDFDGRVFLSTVTYIVQNPTEVFAQAVSTWGALKTPVRLPALKKWLGSPKLAESRPATDTPESLQLLPFNNSVLNKHLPLIVRPQATREAPQVSEKFKAYLHFGRGTMFTDTQHWHNQKSILPAHMGGKPEKPANDKAAMRRLKKSQQFMFNLQMQAATITGASGSVLRQMIIPSVGKGKGAVERRAPPIAQVKQAKRGKKNEKPAKLSSKQLLLQKIQDEKLSDANESSKAWWKAKLAGLEGMGLDAQVQELSYLLRNKRAEEELLRLEMQTYQLHLEVQRWTLDDTPSAPETKDKFSLSIMRLIKEMVDKKVLTVAGQEAITTILTVFGFKQFVEGMLKGVRILDGTPSFKFKKLVKSKTGAPVYEYMVIEEDAIEWQLRLFGEYMDRSMDSAPDARVPFEPDAWQRKVLDCVDNNDSVLVVAPTSAGKTFISFYAMEQILRSSDDDILVYVAPTKALVTQIAAEIYARFSKKMDSKSCWAIHTRDYRINDPQKCQILVTVPEILAIMLLSPPLASVWTPKIKRIVLDEIHSIGQQEGGAVWEQILLLAPCPIIGLSATIGSPEIFNNWLELVQTSHGFKHAFIQHPHRYSHLRKFFYVIDDEPSEFSGLSTHKSTSRTRFLHPISALSFGKTTIPDDLALEAGDTLTLYRALLSVQGKSGVDVKSLDPVVYFAGKKELLKQKDILEYEAELKHAVATLLDSNDRKDFARNVGLEVVSKLQDPTLKKLGSKLDIAPTRDSFTENLIQLLADLHVQNQLPAILFNFDRSGCETIALALREALEEAESRYKETSLVWKRKLAQWEVWKINAKERERQQAERQKKRKPSNNDDESGGGNDGPDPAASTWTWEQSFDPDQPLPDFSFVDYKSSYTLSELEQEIRKLSWGGHVQEWAFALLRRGIGVHHAGMNKGYRSLLEALFRRGFLRVVIATGTLALGINAPAKTSVFCADSPFLTALMYRQCAGRAGRRGYDLLGNVIFYGLPMDRVQRLILSKIPLLGGGFPVTSTLVLRLCNLLEESNRAPNVVKAIDALMTLPRISFSSDVGHDYLMHHVQFSIEYLRRNGLLNEEGKPMNLFAVAGHLYYTEPSNLALVGLLRAGVLHSICRNISPGTSNLDIKMEQAKRTYILLMSHLFGRKLLPVALSGNQKMIKELTTKYPSTIVLPALPKYALKALKSQAKDILEVFVGYARAYGASRAQSGGETAETQLPLSGTWTSKPGSESAGLTAHIRKTAIPTTIRSPFVANSGLHDGDFNTIQELGGTVRTDIHLNPHAIPNLDGIIATANTPAPVREGLTPSKAKTASSGMKAPLPKLNAYLYDFYIHGQPDTIVRGNGIRRGDLWYLIEDFRLTLLTIKAALEQLLVRASATSAHLRAAAATTAGQKATTRRKVPKAKTNDDWDASDSSDDDDDEDSDEDEDDDETDSDVVEGSTIAATVASRDESTLLDLDLNTLDPAEGDDGGDGLNMDFKRPSGVTSQDWMVYRVVSLACAEFDTKAKEMWA